MKLSELIPGQIVSLDNDRATFVAMHTPHPRYPNLVLALWHVHPSSWLGTTDYRWSHDALDARQDIGELAPEIDQSVEASWARLLELLPS